MQSNAGKKTPELTGRRAGGRAGGQEALPGEPVSPRGLAPASRCPGTPEHRRGSDPLAPRDGSPRDGSTPAGDKPGGARRALGSLRCCPRCLHHACPSEELPRSCAALRTRSRLCAEPEPLLGLGTLPGQDRTRSPHTAAGPGLAATSLETPATRGAGRPARSKTPWPRNHSFPAPRVPGMGTVRWARTPAGMPRPTPRCPKRVAEGKTPSHYNSSR